MKYFFRTSKNTRSNKKDEQNTNVRVYLLYLHAEYKITFLARDRAILFPVIVRNKYANAQKSPVP